MLRPMDPFFISLAVAALTIPPTLLLGYREGWFSRKKPVATQAPTEQRQSTLGEANYVGIAEVRRFSAMRRRVGYRPANRIMHILATRVSENTGYETGRVGRSSIEFLYRADTLAAATAMMEDLKRKLEAQVCFDEIEFDAEIVIGSNPICETRQRGELFDVASYTLEDARSMPGGVNIASDLSELSETDRSANMLYDLRAAIKADELELVYMPKLGLRDNSICSAEALCRWTHREHGAVSPMILVDDILDIAKMETSETALDVRETELSRLLGEIHGLWREAASSKGLQLACTLENVPDRAMIDGERLRQILSNLLANAIKFTREGRIDLDIRGWREGDEDRIDFVVRDTGIGIDPEHHQSIFDAFTQVNNSTTREFSGTGLGLAICRKLAEAMGGTITLSSAPGEGSTFTLSLPVVRINAAA